MKAPDASASRQALFARPFESTVVPLLRDDVDTDQIIPARYLKGTERTGLGEGLFAGWRYLSEGQKDPEFELHQPHFQGGQILLGGDNFGCGSSREHAVWALMEQGFRVVLAPRFADIFRTNALGNGLLVIDLSAESHQELSRRALAEAPFSCRVDLSNQELQWAEGGRFSFQIDPFARGCLLRGEDRLGYLLAQASAIDAFEVNHPFRPRTLLKIADSGDGDSGSSARSES
ncbi:MAG: 3-isopropylmalate dehydratase small subunit [Deltaproteobacteria bacterium]|nr:3-isopropylmalate dehydratase small subunit [Deltaproteobacteria bacterium]